MYLRLCCQLPFLMVPSMPNDAKLGLILGIGLVVMIGMVFFRANPPADGANSPPTTSFNSGLVPTDPGNQPIDPLIN